jgi:predicted nucleotidyltransferase
MKSEIISSIKNKLGFLSKNPEVIDVIIFGSAIKGKTLPSDIDIAIIIRNDLPENINNKIRNLENFHVSIIKCEEFFLKTPSIVSTILREGYSIKNSRYVAENFRFSSRVLFSYSLVSLNPSRKVKVVNLLRGKGSEKGMVEKNGGEWIANQVFISPVSAGSFFEEFFNNFKIRYRKNYILIH